MGDIWQWTDAVSIAGFLLGAAGCVWLDVRAYAATGSLTGVVPGMTPTELRARVKRTGPLVLIGLGMALVATHAILTIPSRGTGDQEQASPGLIEALLFGGALIGFASVIWISVRIHRATGHPMGIVSEKEAEQIRTPVRAVGPYVLLSVSTLMIVAHAVVTR